MAALAALIVAACGASTTTTTVTAPATTATSATSSATESKTATTVTSTANPKAAKNPAKGHDYPRVFETSFLKACTASATQSQCNCALSNIEAHLSYATVVREAQAGTFTGSPEYKLAVSSCVGQ